MTLFVGPKPELGSTVTFGVNVEAVWWPPQTSPLSKDPSDDFQNLSWGGHNRLQFIAREVQKYLRLYFIRKTCEVCFRRRGQWSGGMDRYVVMSNHEGVQSQERDSVLYNIFWQRRDWLLLPDQVFLVLGTGVTHSLCVVRCWTR